jgi:outer membrane murein-binding lipoprotein Lpp
MVNKTVISGAIAALLAGPAMAQTATLEQVSKEIAEIKAKNERLEAEVDYLKENAKATRKDNAVEAVDVANIKTSTGKFTWSGDFRYRNEQIETATNNTTEEYTQGRDRIRLRFGVTAKINDTITGRFQIATAGGATNDPRSTNQTLGEDWSRKSVGIDLAYIDWKPTTWAGLQLGKMPQPWTRTTSYFWDGDITPEGAAGKLAFGNFTFGVNYLWLNERHTNAAAGPRSDNKMISEQLVWKQPIGKTTLTLAASYYEVTNIKDEQVTAGGTAPCAATANGTFFGNSTNGNTTYTAVGGCSRLLSAFSVAQGLAQLDFNLGTLPLTVFADYSQNLDAEVNPVAGDKLDTAYAAGIVLGKASAAKSWDVGVVYQISEADAIFGQFHDSDFGAGRTDTEGYAVKAGFAPAANWVINGTLFINKLNNDTGSLTTKDLDYKRLQLDLNFKF